MNTCYVWCSCKLADKLPTRWVLKIKYFSNLWKIIRTLETCLASIWGWLRCRSSESRTKSRASLCRHPRRSPPATRMSTAASRMWNSTALSAGVPAAKSRRRPAETSSRSHWVRSKWTDTLRSRGSERKFPLDCALAASRKAWCRWSWRRSHDCGTAESKCPE